MLLYIDFQRDLDDLVVADLTSRGYVRKPKHGRIDHFCIWYESISRFIPAQTYRVHLSPELLANPLYVVCKGVVDEIAMRLEQGQNVSPYLSSKTLKLRERDHLLIHWGIHHLHLESISTMQSDGLIKRSANLLFIRVDRQSVYMIDILKHGNKRKQTGEFEDDHLLNVVDKNWPHLHMELKGVLASQSSDKTPNVIRQIRRSNLSTFEYVNGRVIMPTLGPSSAGSPTAATIEFHQIQCQLEQLTLRLRNDLTRYFRLGRNQWMACVRLAGFGGTNYELLETFSKQIAKVEILGNQETVTIFAPTQEVINTFT